MSGSGREALPDVRGKLGGLPGCPGIIGRHFGMSGSGQKTFSVFRGLSRMFGRGREARPRVVGRFSRMSWSGREALPDV